jgi:hypothetical protein
LQNKLKNLFAKAASCFLSQGHFGINFTLMITLSYFSVNQNMCVFTNELQNKLSIKG